MKKLEVISVRKSFSEGAVKAVRDISFTVPEGIIFGLVGRNGAGKTTTIRMIMDIYTPDSGKILFKGRDRSQDFHKTVGYLPEERGLYGKMSIIDNLLFLAEIKGVNPNSIKSKIFEYLERFELTEKANEKVSALSKGNQQKVQIIGTILHDPELVILDEPFSGLDPVNTNILKDLILDLKKSGKIIMLSTHMMDMAERMCDHLALVHHGELLLNSSVSEIKRQHSESNISLDFDGDINFIRTLHYVRTVEDFGRSTSIKVADQSYVQPLLHELIKHNVVIKKFESGDVSLHDIFVKFTNDGVDKSEVKLTQSNAKQIHQEKEVSV